MVRPKKTVTEEPSKVDGETFSEVEFKADADATENSSIVNEDSPSDEIPSQLESRDANTVLNDSNKAEEASVYIAKMNIAAMITATQSEIERCNDYIFANADSDRRFTTYRSELYEYRYKLRQLIFDPNFPHMDKVKLPELPECIPDQ